jgi:hypothetical protein
VLTPVGEWSSYLIEMLRVLLDRVKYFTPIHSLGACLEPFNRLLESETEAYTPLSAIALVS